MKLKFLKNQKGFSLIFLLLVGLILTCLILGGLIYFKKINLPFQSSPKTYSVVNFNKKNTYKIEQGNILTGKAIPKSEIKLSFYPGKVKEEIKVGENGQWSYVLADDLKPGSYRLSILNFDKKGTIAWAKSIRVEIVKKKSLLGYVKELMPSPEEAKAINGGPGTGYDWQRLLGDEWVAWLNQWHKSDIYPFIDEDGEIIFASKDTYAEVWCPDNSCIVPVRSFSDWQEDLKDDNNFFVDLYVKLALEGYAEDAFIDYFPEWKEFLALNRINYINSVPRSALKHSIEPEVLSNYITELAIKKKYTEKDQFRYWLNTTDGVTGGRAIYNIVWGYKLVNFEDYISVALLLLPYAPEVRVMGKTYLTSIPKMFNKEAFGVMSSKINALRKGALLSRSEMIGKEALDIEMGYSQKLGRVFNSEALYRLFPKVSSADSEWRRNMLSTYIPRLIVQKKAFVVDSGVLKPMVEDLLAKIKGYNNGEMLKRGVSFDEKAVYEIVDNRRVIYIEDEEVFKNLIDMPDIDSTPMFYSDGMIFIYYKYKYLTQHILHEFIHATAHNTGKYYWQKSTSALIADKVQAEKIASILNSIEELMADEWVRRIYGGGDFTRTFGYRVYYEEVDQGIAFVINRINKKNPGAMTYDDFLEYGLTLDGRSLITKILNNLSPEEFIVFFDERILVDDLTKLSLNESQMALTRMLQVAEVQVGNGGNYLTITQALLRSLLGERLGDAVVMNTDLTELQAEGLVRGSTSVSQEPKITITEVDGNAEPGSQLEVTAVCSQDGVVLDPNQCNQTWTIEPVAESPNSCNYDQKSEEYECRNGYKCYNDFYKDQESSCNWTPIDPHFHCDPDPACGSTSFNFVLPQIIKEAKAQEPEQLPDLITEVTPLQGGSNCHGQCSVTLPGDIGPGNYNLVVYLTRPGSAKVLDGDTQRINLSVGSSPKQPISQTDNSTKLFTDSEGNRIPFWAIHLGSDETGSAESLRDQAQARLAEMQDFTQSLDSLLAKVSDPTLKNLITTTNSQITQKSSEVNACIKP